MFYPEISLNAGIVSNKGFINQFASPGTKLIAGKYVSAWGGIQSTGQTLGQIVGLSCDEECGSSDVILVSPVRH